MDDIIKIPQSVLIADTRQKLEELSKRELPPSVLELLFKEAWINQSLKAEQEVKQDYADYRKAQEESQNEETE